MTTAEDVIAERLNTMIGEDHTDRGLQHMAGEVISALLSAPDSVRLELEAMLNPWRPIETAPKEPLDKQGYGPTILTFVDGCVGVGFWDRDFQNIYAEYPPDAHGQATHWLPLPAPPSEDK